jgi:hypothetical protein
MTLNEIRTILDAVMITNSEVQDVDILRAYCADLMSDVLSFSISNSLLITGLTNAQVIRTADFANIRAVVFVRSKRPDAGMIALAEGKKIPLLMTDLSMFDACGRLYEKGLRSQLGTDAG